MVDVPTPSSCSAPNTTGLVSGAGLACVPVCGWGVADAGWPPPASVGRALTADCPVGTTTGVLNAAAVRAALAGVCSGVQAVSTSTAATVNARRTGPTRRDVLPLMWVPPILVREIELAHFQSAAATRRSDMCAGGTRS